MTERNLGAVYTLVDVLRMMDPNNERLLFVGDVLARRTPMLQDAPIMEANQALTHIGTRDIQLPTVGKRAINDGVIYAAHKETPITAPMSLFETFSRVDEEILRLAGKNASAVRQRKDRKFIEAMSQAVQEEAIYGSVGDDELGFNGFNTLFNSLTTYPNGDSTWYYNVLDGGGSGSDTCSILVVEWGAEKCHFIYPKGTQAGIEINDLGKQLVQGYSGSGYNYVAMVTQFKWRMGLFVQDERCVQRIANVESAGSTNTFNDNDLLTMCNRLPEMGENDMTRIYVNRTVRTQMDIKVKDKNNVNYTMDTAFGKPVLRFRGIPVQICDALTNTETAI